MTPQDGAPQDGAPQDGAPQDGVPQDGVAVAARRRPGLIAVAVVGALLAAATLTGVAVIRGSAADGGVASGAADADADGLTGAGLAAAGLAGFGQGPQGIPPAGVPVAVLEIPRLRGSWRVVQGVAPENIEHFPGHFPASAMPGEIGNFSVAGHRVRGTFYDMDRMRRGDRVIVRTRDYRHVYRVTRTRIVLPTATEVVAPVPGRRGAVPSAAMLTLTTCEPKWDNTHRLIVHAVLVDSVPSF